MRFKVILAMVKEEYQDPVIQAAKKAGATGVTILNARGEGIHEQKSFLGMSVEAQREVLLFLVEDFISDGIMDEISKAGHFLEHGGGMAFSFEIDRAIGLESQIKALEEEAKENYF
jgi:nitrogen regulatory protein P-II 1